MKWLCVIPLVFLFSACTPIGEAVVQEVKVKGADIYDSVLDESAWTTCEAVSIGSVKRKYGRTQEDADAYNTFCNIGHSNVDIVSPVD